jgi:type II secretory pathway component PulK
MVLTILIAIVAGFSDTVTAERRIVQNGIEDQEMSVAARGLFAYMGTLFRDNAKDPNPTIQNADGLCNNWDDPNLDSKLHQLTVGDVQLQFRVEDLERRLSLEWLCDPIRAQFALTSLTRLLGKLQVDKPDTVALAIANQVRSVAGLQPLSAPTSSTGQPAPPAPPPPPPPPPPAPGELTPPPRRSILDVEELLDTQGVENLGTILYGNPTAQPPTEGLVTFVTCWPTEGININSAPYEVLVSILPTQTKATVAPTANAGRVGGAGMGGTPAPQPGGATTPTAGGQPIDVEALSAKIRAHRIDPLYEQQGQPPPATANGKTAPPPPPPPPPPPAAGGSGAGSGASKSWSPQSKYFQQLSELSQFPELQGYFQPGPTQPGQPGQPAPPPSPVPGKTVTPGTPGAPGAVFDVGQALVTTSRFYAVYVTATAPSGATKIVHLVLSRNKQGYVSPLLYREQPR